MWLLNKISCEIQILNEKVGKLMIENSKLEEENEKLKSDLAYERTILDNVRAEYESSQNIIKRLKEEIDKYEALYGRLYI